MKPEIKPGKYIIAVSGGIDSMVLLDALAKDPTLELIVAHFNHGIRTDSDEDEVLVSNGSHERGLRFVSEKAHLGPGVSEDIARIARYKFLHQIRVENNAQAVITAHHQSDVLETMIINLIRGTNRKGLASLRSHDTVIRPLLHVSKDEIRAYAREHAVQWREDSTNADLRYLRNYLRRQIMPNLSADAREQLLAINARAREQNQAIDELAHEVLVSMGDAERLNRQMFIMLPQVVAKEIMARWLRLNEVQDISKQQIERLVAAAKTGRLHATYDIDRLKIMNISRKFLEITSRDSRNSVI